MATHGRRSVHTLEDLLALLDRLSAPQADRWTARSTDYWESFYDQRDRDIPFLRAVPEESLVGWHEDGRLALGPGVRALELGCGPGRNAVWLAQRGCEVDALDLSPRAVRWGEERAAEAEVEVNFVLANIFDWQSPSTPYDVVFDSGCFHHLPPHRRISYRTLLERTLAPGAFYGLSCFALGGMGSAATDEAFYRPGGPVGGLAYTAQDLRSIFGWLEEVEVRRMRRMSDDSSLFGESVLWAAAFRRSNETDPPG